MGGALFHHVLLGACFLLIVVGFGGILVPLIPSIPFIWFGIVLYGIATDFSVVNASFLLLISILGLTVVLLDFIAHLWGGKEFRASFWSVIGAVLGGIAGSFFGYLFGFVVGPLVGAIVSQLLIGRDTAFALETKRYVIIGYVGGTIIKFTVAVAMIGLFLWRVTTG